AKGRDAEHHVRLASRQAVEPSVRQQFDADLRMQPAELGEDGRQHVGSKPIRRGDAQRALKLRLVAGEPALEGERFFLDTLGVTENDMAFVSQDEAISGPLEKSVAHSVLERAQSPPHRRLCLTKLPGDHAKSTLAGHRQEDSKITPV